MVTLQGFLFEFVCVCVCVLLSNFNTLLMLFVSSIGDVH